MSASLPFAVVGVLLFGVPGPAAAQESKWTTVADDGIGETTFKSLDLVRLAAASTSDQLEMRMELVTAPQPTGPEAYVTTFREFTYIFTVSFELRKQSATPTEAYIVALVATANMDVQNGPSGLAHAGVSWAHSARISNETSPMMEDESSATLPIRGLGGGGPSWQIDRHRWDAEVGLLGPSEGWLLSNIYASSTMRGLAAESTVYWAVRQSIARQFGTDRAPDIGYGQTFLVPGRGVGSEAPSSSSASSTHATPEPLRFDPVTRFSGATSAPASAYTIGFSAAVAGAVLVALLPRPGFLFVAGLFSRILDKDAATHPRRALILEALRERPMGFADLRTITGFGSGPLAHHLAVLERHGIIWSQVLAGRRAYCLPELKEGMISPPPSAERVLQAVSARPGCSTTELARETGLARTAALYHLEQFEAQGVIRSARHGRQRRFFLAKMLGR